MVGKQDTHTSHDEYRAVFRIQRWKIRGGKHNHRSTVRVFLRLRPTSDIYRYIKTTIRQIALKLYYQVTANTSNT